LKRHLAVFTGSAIDDILQGRKKIDCRLSRIRIPPFGQVGAGDLIYLKPPGRPIVGQFLVERVVFFDTPGKRGWEWVRRWRGDLAVTDKFLADRQDCRYLSLIWIGTVASFLTPPRKIVKSDRRPWVVL
jgi:hypothetical protein